jgi:hypothetical protein
MQQFKGGFPPIKYCPEKVDTSDKKINTRERLFSSNINKNINVRQILKENVSKPLIEINDDKKDEIEVVDTI